jgi:hypothetical protein
MFWGILVRIWTFVTIMWFCILWNWCINTFKSCLVEWVKLDQDLQKFYENGTVILKFSMYVIKKKMEEKFSIHIKKIYRIIFQKISINCTQYLEKYK